MGMKWYDWLAVSLLIIGGVNWGLVGLFNYDLVLALLGTMPMVAKTVYALVGASAIYSLVTLIAKNA